MRYERSITELLHFHNADLWPCASQPWCSISLGLG